MVILLALACNKPVAHEDSGEAVTVTIDDTALHSDGWEATPSIPLNELGLATDEAVSWHNWGDPRVPIEVIEELLANADEDCPSVQPMSSFDRYNGECTSQSGTEFIVDFMFSHKTDEVTDGAQVHESWTLNGEGRIVTPEGHEAWFAMENTLQDSSSQQTRRQQARLVGVFSWDGPSQEGTWIKKKASFNYTFAYQSSDKGPAISMALDGGLSGFSGERIDAVSFEEFVLGNGESKFSCQDEPLGTVKFRTRVGEWYFVEFYVDEHTSGAPVACDGCGEAYFNGHAMGQVCLDLSGHINWETTPW